MGGVLVGAFEVVADRGLSGRRRGVHHLADPRLATPNGLAFGHARGRHDLRRHALDLLGTAVVVAGIDHVACSSAICDSSFSSDIPIGPMRRPLRNCLTTGSSLVSSTSRGPNITRCLRNSMPMLSGTVRAMLMLCVTIRIVQSIWALMSISSWLR